METESINPVLLGIISSLIATFIFISISKLFFQVVLPWYEDKIYRGVRIDGKWLLGEKLNDNDNESTLVLRQSGDKISGIHYHKIEIEDSKTISESYNVRGFVRDGYFFATFDPVSRNIVDSGTIHMKIYKHKGTLSMKGSLSGVLQLKGSVFIADMILATKCE